MIDELFAGDLWLLLLVQGTACLAVGLAVSYVLRHRPARAHQVLLTALLASVLMPGLYVSARHFGLGVLTPQNHPAGTQRSRDSAAANRPPCRDRDDGVHYDPASSEVEFAEAVPAYPVTRTSSRGDIVTMACWLTATLVLLMRLSLRFLLGLHLLRTAAPLESRTHRSRPLRRPGADSGSTNRSGFDAARRSAVPSSGVGSASRSC